LEQAAHHDQNNIVIPFRVAMYFKQ